MGALRSAVLLSASIPIKRTSQLKKPCPKWYNQDVKCASNAKKKAFAVLSYEKAIVDKAKKNPKLLYNYINSNKKCKELIRSLRLSDGELTTDHLQIANILNDQFFSAFSAPSSTADGTPSLQLRIDHRLESIQAESFSSIEVSKALKKLNKCKPAGIDGVHPHILNE